MRSISFDLEDILTLQVLWNVGIDPDQLEDAYRQLTELNKFPSPYIEAQE